MGTFVILESGRKKNQTSLPLQYDRLLRFGEVFSKWYHRPMTFFYRLPVQRMMRLLYRFFLVCCIFLLPLQAWAAPGGADPIFTVGTGPSSVPYEFVIQPDGKIVIAGIFISYNGTSRKGIARINSDGTLDTTLNAGTAYNSGSLNSIALQADGKIIVGGTSFTSFNGTIRSRIVRLNANGSVDLGFDPGLGADNEVDSIVVLPDGKILIGGSFVTFDGTVVGGIARLNSDGSLDMSFNSGGSGFDGQVQSILRRSNGKIVVMGSFGIFDDTQNAVNIIQLNEDGTYDSSFDADTYSASDQVMTGILQSDGKLIIGGDFTSYAGESRNRLARINEDGSLDVTFDPGTGPNATVNTISIQSDGKILVGGSFSSWNGVTGRLFRLLSDGTVDPDFTIAIGATGNVEGIRLQDNGKIVVSGGFTIVSGESKPRLTRLLWADPGVATSTITGHTTEAGGTATFTVSLTTMPAADVTIGISSSDLTEGTVSPSALTFTSSTWNVPQTVTVTGVSDLVVDGAVGYSITLAATVSDDVEYNGIATSGVSVINDDDAVYTLIYSAGQNGSISGSSTQNVNRLSSGSSVSAVASTGYAFTQWSDGSTENPRTEVSVTGNVSVVASFHLINTGGGGGFMMPIAVGSGANTVNIPMDTMVGMDTLDIYGVNILGYIRSRLYFKTPVSHDGSLQSHFVAFDEFDLLHKRISLRTSASLEPTVLDFGSVQRIDLDGDFVPDISLEFSNIYINRFEVTLKSLISPQVISAQPLSATSPSAHPVFHFLRDLKTGSSGEDVKELQMFLNAQGFIVAKAGPGSLGYETTMFGAATRLALIRFQKVHKIIPAVGYFGPLTRVLVASLQR